MLSANAMEDLRKLGHENPEEEVENLGLDARQVESQEAEEADAVLCIRKASASPESLALFDDNVECPCSLCGETVIHRPSAPSKPPKICHQCFSTGGEV